jgi:hypothetical protein
MVTSWAGTAKRLKRARARLSARSSARALRQRLDHLHAERLDDGGGTEHQRTRWMLTVCDPRPLSAAGSARLRAAIRCGSALPALGHRARADRRALRRSCARARARDRGERGRLRDLLELALDQRAAAPDSQSRPRGSRTGSSRCRARRSFLPRSGARDLQHQAADRLLQQERIDRKDQTSSIETCTRRRASSVSRLMAARSSSTRPRKSVRWTRSARGGRS